MNRKGLTSNIMAKLRTNQETQHLKKKPIATTVRATKRKARKGKKHLSAESKEAKLATHDAASQYYQLYLRKISSQKAFQVWLSEVIGAPKKDAVRWSFVGRVVHYFTMLHLAITSKL